MCADIDECLIPGSCSQHCTNTLGGFNCSCLPGYRPDPQDLTRCRAERGRLALLFAHRTDIRLTDLRRQETVAVVERTRSAVGLDFHHEAGQIFWSDTVEGRIYRVKLADEKQRTGSGNVTTSSRRFVVDRHADDGLAVDWVNDILYFVKSVDNRRTISVTDFDGRAVFDLITDGLDKPRSLALHPGKGWLFWSDWGRQPKIEKAGMDGTHREVLVKDGLVWPNGITLDLVGERLYWVDAKLHRLSSLSVHGGGEAVRVVLESVHHLHHPYGLTVFEDWVYWTEWGRNTSAIYRANKFTGSQLSQFKESNMVSLQTTVLRLEGSFCQWWGSGTFFWIRIRFRIQQE